ncbi:acyl-CoA carboxylase subunit beta [Lentzea sp. NPDC058436]|uniref:acyl-CoA carboxylase subunit beta n=1 Tax=Lentzea sp. NPDC058436 TaxID=3346499 RepID=UPI00364F220B
MRERTSSLAALKSEAAGDRAAEIQHAKGKLTARERLGLLFDPGTFTELEALRRHRATAFGMAERRPHGDGVVVGWGEVSGRTVFAYAHDFQVFGGSLGEAHAAKIQRVMDLAASAGAPLVALCDGAGARIQEGVGALAGFGGIFTRNVRSSGVIPQIAVMLGPCAGGAAYSPALCDFVFMVRGTAQMFLTGPDVVRAVTGEDVTREQLGGAEAHAERSGLASFVYDDEESCLADVRYLLSLLPANNRELPPKTRCDDPPDRRCEKLLDLVPADPSRTYDVLDVLTEIVDDATLFEVQAGWARNVVCALARLGGDVVGIVANQPSVLAGAIDISAAEKAARFVRMCDAFNVPLVTVVDVPGFLPGVDQEHGGIIRHGAQLLYAYCDATVPRLQVVVRKAYGGAYIVLDSKSVGADVSLAWPTNEIAVMGAEGAANIVFRKEIAASADPEATRRRKIAEYRDELMNPYYAAERGLVDDVIDPADTRSILISSLVALRNKHVQRPDRKHGNHP